jgi:ribonuclease D
MKTAYRWVDEDHFVVALAERLRAVPNYAIDTEFHREKTYFPQLALIQIRVEDDTYLLDAPNLSAAAVADLFKNSAVAIVHAAQQDLEILSLELGPHGELLPTPPKSVAAFAELSNHRRVVRHLNMKINKDNF